MLTIEKCSTEMGMAFKKIIFDLHLQRWMFQVFFLTNSQSYGWELTIVAQSGPVLNKNLICMNSFRYYGATENYLFVNYDNDMEYI